MRLRALARVTNKQARLGALCRSLPHVAMAPKRKFATVRGSRMEASTVTARARETAVWRDQQSGSEKRSQGEAVEPRCGYSIRQRGSQYARAWRGGAR